MNRTPTLLTTTAAAGLLALGLAAPAVADGQQTEVNPSFQSHDDDVMGSLQMFSVDEDGDGFRFSSVGQRMDDDTHLEGSAVTTDGDERTGGAGQLTLHDDERADASFESGTTDDGETTGVTSDGAFDEDGDGSFDATLRDDDQQLGVSIDPDEGIEVRTPDDDV